MRNGALVDCRELLEWNEVALEWNKVALEPPTPAERFQHLASEGTVWLVVYNRTKTIGVQ